MGSLPPSDPDEDYDRSGALTRIRPFARVAFAIVLIPLILRGAGGLCFVVYDICRQLFVR